MKKIFPCYTDYFKTSYTVSETIRRIEEIVMNNNKFKLLSDDHYKTQKMVLSTNNEGYICYNSFVPIVNIEIQESKDEVIVFMRFELRKSIKVFLMAYWMLLLLIQVIILIPLMTKQSSGNLVLLIPIGMAFYALCLGSIGLKCSGKQVYKMLANKIEDTY